MRKLSLDAKAREHLERAAASSTGRSAETLHGRTDTPRAVRGRRGRSRE
ncbi:hypothetical protein [Streptomyces anandii]